jgi:hypothetical protein
VTSVDEVPGFAAEDAEGRSGTLCLLELCVLAMAQHGTLFSQEDYMTATALGICAKQEFTALQTGILASKCHSLVPALNRVS